MSAQTHPGDGGAGPAPVLVLGVGNELFTDEGLGCVAARAVAELGLPGVDVLDGSTLGIALLPSLADREAVLLLDATVGRDAAPGDVMVLLGDEVPASRQLTVSAHQIGVSEALAAAELAGCRPPRLAAVGMVPVSLETGYGVSDAVAQRIPLMVQAACRILRDWGVAVPQDLAGAGTEPVGGSPVGDSPVGDSHA